MADIGYAAILLTLVTSLYAAFAYLLGERHRAPELLESAHNAVWTSAALATVASGALLYLLERRDFSIRYVYQHTSTFQPALYNLSAFWAGQEGSLLLWLWLLGIFALTLLTSRRAFLQDLKPVALAVISATEALFALVLLAFSNPFARLAVPQAEGFGLNPLLQNIGMVLHPPVVFVGYAGFTVPFALVVAALVKGRFTRQWVREVRPWLLVAWLFLGVGIVIGGWWAYQELGWGGYWGWDPVENSSLVPWLVATAALHAGIVQERRGGFLVWNAALIASSFVLCLFATFVTRSGVIQSVHAFGGSAEAWVFAAFIVGSLALTAWLLVRHRRDLDASDVVESLVSREGGFLFTVLLFVGLGAAVFLGTVYPALVELLRGQEVALDASFYNRVFGPLALLLLLLLGVCPALLWRRTEGRPLLARLWPGGAGAALSLGAALALGAREAVPLVGFTAAGFAAGTVLWDLLRALAIRREGKGRHRVDRRRLGAHLVHLGVLLMTVGIVGSSVYKTEHQVVLLPGEEVSVSGYTLRYVQPLRGMDQAKQRTAVELAVSHEGKALGTLTPERNFYWNMGQVVTEVALRSSWREDLYVVLAALQDDGMATLQVQVAQMVWWIWVGGFVLLAGALVSLWPERGKEPVPVEVRGRREALAEEG
ncbi:MAG: heme lyase CcmF/NrfE family subunit [Anaerolineae bacterium]